MDGINSRKLKLFVICFVVGISGTGAVYRFFGIRAAVIAGVCGIALCFGIPLVVSLVPVILQKIGKFFKRLRSQN